MATTNWIFKNGSEAKNGLAFTATTRFSRGSTLVINGEDRCHHVRNYSPAISALGSAISIGWSKHNPSAQCLRTWPPSSSCSGATHHRLFPEHLHSHLSSPDYSCPLLSSILPAARRHHRMRRCDGGARLAAAPHGGECHWIRPPRARWSPDLAALSSGAAGSGRHKLGYGGPARGVAATVGLPPQAGGFLSWHDEACNVHALEVLEVFSSFSEGHQRHQKGGHGLEKGQALF
uniref:Uncharacterized protein n=1 Tax=Oryza glumipatula TaxID=40148 RepID=A0A0D9ZAT8_9ORYZ